MLPWLGNQTMDTASHPKAGERRHNSNDSPAQRVKATPNNRPRPSRDTRGHITELPRLRPLTTSDRVFLRRFGHPRDCPKQTILLRSGTPADEVFLVESGEVEVYVTTGDSKTVLFRSGPGELLGAFAALSRQACETSVATTQDSRFIVLTAQQFRCCLAERPALLSALILKLIVTVTDLSQKLGVQSLDAYGRIRYYLDSLATNDDGRRVVDGHWTRNQFAELASCTRETVTRILLTLEQGGWIRVEGNKARHRIVIIKPLPKHL